MTPSNSGMRVELTRDASGGNGAATTATAAAHVPRGWGARAFEQPQPTDTGAKGVGAATTTIAPATTTAPAAPSAIPPPTAAPPPTTAPPPAAASLPASAVQPWAALMMNDDERSAAFATAPKAARTLTLTLPLTLTLTLTLTTDH